MNKLVMLCLLLMIAVLVNVSDNKRYIKMAPGVLRAPKSRNLRRNNHKENGNKVSKITVRNVKNNDKLQDYMILEDKLYKDSYKIANMKYTL